MADDLSVLDLPSRAHVQVTIRSGGTPRVPEAIFQFSFPARQS